MVGRDIKTENGGIIKQGEAPGSSDAAAQSLERALCNVSVERVEPVYDSELITKLNDFGTEEQYTAMLSAMEAQVQQWQRVSGEKGRILFVSDPWIAMEHRGGSLLLRNLYGLLKESGVNVEWWSCDVEQNGAGSAFHEVCYAIYEGLKGERTPGDGKEAGLFEAEANLYDGANRQIVKELSSRAGITKADQIMLLDINAMGLGKHLRALSSAPALIIENLRIGNPPSNAHYAETTKFLEQQGIYPAIDRILHLHESLVVNREREASIGGFSCYADSHNAPLEPGAAQADFDRVAAQARPVSNTAEVMDSLAEGPKSLVCGAVKLPAEAKRIFYLGARIDRSKNQDLALESFGKACYDCPEEMQESHLVLLMPAPSELNNEVEMRAISKVLDRIFNSYHRLSPEVKDKVSIFLVPPSIDGERVNEIFNRACQNLADCHLCLSDAEGLPNSIFEAMRLGKVPLVHAVCGMLDQVEEGVSGFFSYKNSVEELSQRFREIATHENLEAIGEAAYQRLITRFNPLGYVQRFLDCTCACLTEKSEKRAGSKVSLDRAITEVLDDPELPEQLVGETLERMKARAAILERYSEIPALLLSTLGLQSQGVGELERASQAYQELQQRFMEKVDDAFRKMTAAQQAQAIYRFLKGGQDNVFTRDYLLLGTGIEQRLADCGPIGDCNNLSLLFHCLASAAGIQSMLHRDIYHTFASIPDRDGRRTPVDFAYGDEIFRTEYVWRDGSPYHAESGRECHGADLDAATATFVCRYAMDGVADPERERELYAKAAALDPFFAEPYNNLGDLEYFAGNFFSARDFYQRAVDRESHNIFFRLNRLMADCILARKWNPEALLPELEEIQKIYPPFAEAQYMRYVLTRDKEALAKAKEHGFESRELMYYGRFMAKKLHTLEDILKRRGWINE